MTGVQVFEGAGEPLAVLRGGSRSKTVLTLGYQIEAINEVGKILGVLDNVCRRDAMQVAWRNIQNVARFRGIAHQDVLAIRGVLAAQHTVAMLNVRKDRDEVAENGGKAEDSAWLVVGVHSTYCLRMFIHWQVRRAIP
jgi:hypothetical protein